eukprot:10606626-Lingulodinium_polyedra.AAC.1
MKNFAQMIQKVQKPEEKKGKHQHSVRPMPQDEKMISEVDAQSWCPKRCAIVKDRANNRWLGTFLLPS